MTAISKTLAIAKARQELRYEEMRAAVEAEKAKLRVKRSFMSKLFPWVIHISVRRRQ